jgi:hypothetical protein
MFVREVKTDFKGHQIAVRNSSGLKFSPPWVFTEIKLYIDGKVVEINNEISNSGRYPIMRGSIEHDGKIHVVEIYAKDGLRTKMQIHVDGKKIAGDRIVWWL